MTDSTLAREIRPSTTAELPPPADDAQPPAQVPGADGKRILRSILKHAALIIVGGIMIYPLLWMIASSLRPNDIIFREPGILLETLETGNYTDGWNALSNPFGVYLVNSAVVVLGCIIGNLVACSMAAYAFARLNFRFKKPAFALMLLTIMLPFHVVIVPQ